MQNTLTVVPKLSITERVALGKYDWSSKDIKDDVFPNNAATIGKWKWKLAHINREIWSEEEAKPAVEVDGWSAAKTEHILTFGEMFPEEQRKYPIIALGSTGRSLGTPHFLVLHEHERGRYRNLYLLDSLAGFNPEFRFLVVKKQL